MFNVRVGLAPQPLVSDWFIAVTTASGVTALVAAGVTASRWRGAAFVLVAALNQALYVNKLQFSLSLYRGGRWSVSLPPRLV